MREYQLTGVRRKRPEKQGYHETVVAATIAPTLNAGRSQTNRRRELRFAAYPRDTVYLTCLIDMLIYLYDKKMIFSF